MHNLGILYYEGDGVDVNKEKAIYWYTKAAEQGGRKAQNNLGVMYQQGEGVKKNIALAKKYFKQACSLGLEEGCDNYNSIK
nr:tetratricopeptide repeat protein [Gilliamella sp. B3976]